MKAAFNISPTLIIHPETTALVCCVVTHAQTSVPQTIVSSMLGRPLAYISIFKRKISSVNRKDKCSEIGHWPSYDFSAFNSAPLPSVWDWRSLLQRAEPECTV